MARRSVRRDEFEQELRQCSSLRNTEDFHLEREHVVAWPRMKAELIGKYFVKPSAAQQQVSESDHRSIVLQYIHRSSTINERAASAIGVALSNRKIHPDE